jgi:hypothetical protein
MESIQGNASDADMNNGTVRQEKGVWIPIADEFLTTLGIEKIVWFLAA